jgi:60 kDa SS-A/Ro ribonucleoprotein
VLVALKTYEQGHGERGGNTWSPVAKVVDALDGAFYTSFGNVEPTGKDFMLALDVSGSMEGGAIAGMPGITPRIGSAAMSLVTSAVEENTVTTIFSSAGTNFTKSGRGLWGSENGISTIDISKRQRLDDVIRKLSRLPFGGTDCSLPMIYALQNKMPIDTFCVYTDNETWAGDIHPVQALQEYRQKMGIPAKLVVIGMTATEFSIADQNDAGMLDVVGFDTATPSLISDFAKE